MLLAILRIHAMRTIAVLLIAASAGLAAAPAVLAADDATKKLDLVWSVPDVDSIPLRSIALLPPSTFTNDLKAEKEIESAWEQVFRATGHRWYSATLVKDLVKSGLGGDSMLVALHAALLKEPRVDSLTARKLCRVLHTSAVMSVRADQWEQVAIEWNQSGEPWTTVQLKAALVDSSGRLLWTVSGSETAKGAMHSASENNTLGVKSSGLNLQPVTAEGGPPSFQEVLARLLGRWVLRFPARAAAPPASSGN